MEEKVLEELKKIIYFGNLEISEELKMRYARFIIRISNYGKHGYMHIYKEHLIDLEVLIELLEKYYNDKERYNEKYDMNSTQRRLNHKRLFRKFGLPNRIQLENGKIPPISLAEKEVKIDSFARKYTFMNLNDLENFIIYDLKKTENGLELIDLKDVPIYAIFRFCKGIDFRIFSKYHIYHSCDETDIKNWANYVTVKEFADYVELLDDKDKNKKIYKRILTQYYKYREELCERYKPYLYENKAKEQLSDLTNLSKKVIENSPGIQISLVNLDFNKIPSDSTN